MKNQPQAPMGPRVERQEHVVVARSSNVLIHSCDEVVIIGCEVKEITSSRIPDNLTDADKRNIVDLKPSGPKWVRRTDNKYPVGQVAAAATTKAMPQCSSWKGAVVDGITLKPWDVFLVKNQPDPDENGLYLIYVDGEVEKLEGRTTYVKKGTVNADTVWVERD